MSFWSLSTGETVKPETEYEAPQGGDLSPIPDGTDVMAYIDEAKWDKKGEAEYISLRWRVAKPEVYKNRVVFHKLWVMGDNPDAKDIEKAKKQGDNAKKMLSAIDANAGGQLIKVKGIPADEDLQRCLMNKFMVIKLKVWEMTGNNGEKMSGNWICAISSKEKGVAEVTKPAAAEKPFDPVANGTSRYDDDSIPF